MKLHCSLVHNSRIYKSLVPPRLLTTVHNQLCLLFQMYLRNIGLCFLLSLLNALSAFSPILTLLSNDKDKDTHFDFKFAWNRFCSDGSVAVGACFSRSVCGSGYRCDTSRNLCCAVKKPLIAVPVCPNGASAKAACMNGLCGARLTCVNGKLCCRGMFDEPTCPNNAEPAGECMNGLCPCEHDCIDGFCCPRSNTLIALACPNNVPGIGQCQDNTCPVGSTCFNNICCKVPMCPNKDEPVGPCVDGGLCPVGFKCTEDRWCCPSCRNDVKSIGQCIGGLCYPGYVCENDVCCRSQICPDNVTLPAGPCVDDLLCPDDHFCSIDSLCCSNTSKRLV